MRDADADRERSSHRPAVILVVTRVLCYFSGEPSALLRERLPSRGGTIFRRPEDKDGPVASREQVRLYVRFRGFRGPGDLQLRRQCLVL